MPSTLLSILYTIHSVLTLGVVDSNIYHLHFINSEDKYLSPGHTQLVNSEATI